jgi:hypothetical protein
MRISFGFYSHGLRDECASPHHDGSRFHSAGHRVTFAFEDEYLKPPFTFATTLKRCLKASASESTREEANIETSSLPRALLASGYSSSAHYVEDQDHQRHNNQQVDQTSAHMKAEAQKPEDQKNHEKRPKHVALLCSS